MSVLHSSLLGGDLHNSKIAVLGYPIPRPPDFGGELIFSNGKLWVGTGNTLESWQATTAPPPPAFLWSVRTDQYIPPAGNVSTARLYYADVAATDVDANMGAFQIVEIYNVGDNWQPGNPITLNTAIQKWGKGCYTLLLSGNDAYGLPDRASPGQKITLEFADPVGAVTLFDFGAEFTGYADQPYSQVGGFEITVPFAQIVLSIGSQ